MADVSDKAVAAARRKVEVKATAAGIRDTAGRQALAEERFADAHELLGKARQAAGSWGGPPQPAMPVS